MCVYKYELLKTTLQKTETLNLSGPDSFVSNLFKIFSELRAVPAGGGVSELVLNIREWESGRVGEIAPQPVLQWHG